MNNAPYDPHTFSQLYATPLGERLWHRLKSDGYIAAMETATLLHQPAVKGIEEMLLADFSDQVVEDRVKQMIGHMIRQILESRGYEIDQQKVKIDSIPFYSGTRYRRRDEWTYHVWRKLSAPRACALTKDRQGSQLPTLLGDRWLYWRSFSGLLRGSILFGMQSEQTARADIKNQGYHLAAMPRIMRAA